MSRVENEQFPSCETGSSRHLPEDFLIRGHAFSQLYYPEGFFDVMADDEERSIELPSVVVPRTHRCLWLGVRIASVRLSLSVSIRFTLYFYLSILFDLTDKSSSSTAGSPTTLRKDPSPRHHLHTSLRTWLVDTTR
jgi:hypothetical protein